MPDEKNLSRREFLKYAGIAGAVIGAGGGLGGVLAACGSSATSTTTTAAAATTTTAAAPGTTAASVTTTTAAPETTTTTAAGGPVKGGTLNIYINEPVAIEPLDLEESEGVKVGSALFDSLVDFDPITAKIMPAAAAKWDISADAKVFTFHLVPGAKFHDGTPVTAKDFVYAWTRLCNPVNKSNVSYHLEPVLGYDEMQATENPATTLAGVKAVDDSTFEVTLKYAFADFENVVGHPTLAPVPQAAVEKDPTAFAAAPVGNGPFMMDGTWQHDQEIKVKAFADYYGPKPNVDAVDFKIFKDPETAFLEFQAGNLDFTSIPSGQIKATEAQYGTSDNGYTGNPGKQVLLGGELTVYYIDINQKDPLLGKNADLRQAISLAINRPAICQTVFDNTRDPADSVIPPGIAGYEAGAWQYSKYDVTASKAALTKAGFPDGKGLAEITLSCNSGGSHEQIMALVQADLKTVGINVKTDFTEWAAYLPKLQAAQYQLGRIGWQADYPIIDNFLFPLFSSKSPNNYTQYNDPAFESAITAARQMTDAAARMKAYQTIVRQVGDQVPTIPIVFYKHNYVTSDRVYNFTYSSVGIPDYITCWIVQK
jgi:oligopeptide transport system substrate-binding protein